MMNDRDERITWTVINGVAFLGFLVASAYLLWAAYDSFSKEWYDFTVIFSLMAVFCLSSLVLIYALWRHG